MDRVDDVKKWEENGKKKDGLEYVGKEDPLVDYKKGDLYERFVKYDDPFDQLAYRMRRAGLAKAEEKVLDESEPFLEAGALFHPLVGVVNDALSLSAGVDIYDNKVSKGDKGLSLLSLATSFTPLKVVGKTGKKILSAISKTLTTYSAISTYKTQSDKKKKKKLIQIQK